MNCLVGCSGGSCGDPILPINTHNFSPFIMTEFKAQGGLKVTVGNQSAPQINNTAMIKSFEFGKSDGVYFTLEIVDEQGGSMGLIVDQIPKKVGDVSKTGVFVEVVWGWTGMNCDGSPYMEKTPIIKGIPIQLEVNFEGGKIKYKIICSDSMQAVYVAREDKIFGDDDQPIPLKEAIRRLFKDEPPSMDVEFKKADSEEEWEFKDYGKEGPKGSWPTDNQNKLSTAKKWLEPFRTVNNKGIIAYWDYIKGNTIVFLEDPAPECDKGLSCANNIGTFIVNGGNCSNVINFTPKINWTIAFASFGRGGGTSPASGATKKKIKDCADQDETAGTQQAITITEQAFDTHGPKRALEETEKSQNAHNRAETFFTGGLTEPITAELTIQGTTNPNFIHPILSIGKTVSIIVINPFNLRSGGDVCGDWLAEPVCNEVLTNKFWQIQGVGHQISEGSYITTLSLFLGTPTIHFPSGNPLGGPGSGGYTPSTN